MSIQPSIRHGRNQRWSLDFLSDAFVCGRRFRIFAVVDDFTRECLTLVADTSLSGARVVRELDAVIAARQTKPDAIVSDNGTELTSVAILKWAQDTGVHWRYIAPGKLAPAAFAQTIVNSMQWDGPLGLVGGPAHRPIASQTQTGPNHPRTLPMAG